MLQLPPRMSEKSTNNDTRSQKSVQDDKRTGERLSLYPTMSGGLHFCQLPSQPYLPVCGFYDSSQPLLSRLHKEGLLSLLLLLSFPSPGRESLPPLLVIKFCPLKLGFLYLCLSSWVDDYSCSLCLMVPGTHRSLMNVEWINGWAQTTSDPTEISFSS